MYVIALNGKSVSAERHCFKSEIKTVFFFLRNLSFIASKSVSCTFGLLTGHIGSADLCQNNFERGRTVLLLS
jgi:hypothetical protein